MTQKFLQYAVWHQGGECLKWPYAVDSNGYGKMNWAGRPQMVSRLVCEFRHGPPQNATDQAAHSCGKGHEACCNPNHLDWKSPKENQADRVIHGTDNCGERHGNAKLTTQQVAEIRAMEGVRHSDIAEMYGVTRGVISRILRHEIWVNKD